MKKEDEIKNDDLSPEEEEKLEHLIEIHIDRIIDEYIESKTLERSKLT